MRITESQLRRIIREEITSSMHESFLSKTADFFGSSNKTGRDVKSRAGDLLYHPNFERWHESNKSANWKQKLLDIRKMGQHTAAEELKTVQQAEKQFEEWLNRHEVEAEVKRQNDPARKKKEADERKKQQEEQALADELDRNERKRKAYERKFARDQENDLVATGEDASGNLIYITRADYDRHTR